MLEDKDLKNWMALTLKMDNRLEQIEKGLSQINNEVKHLTKIKNDIVIGVNNTNVLNENLIAISHNLLLFIKLFKDNA
jgi:hypothetical protein